MKYQREVIRDAQGEPPVTAASIVDEIAPLLKEYFVASCRVLGEGISICLPNGQEFLLTVAEK